MCVLLTSGIGLFSKKHFPHRHARFVLNSVCGYRGFFGVQVEASTAAREQGRKGGRLDLAITSFRRTCRMKSTNTNVYTPNEKANERSEPLAAGAAPAPGWQAQ